jgi:transposase-like protein
MPSALSAPHFHSDEAGYAYVEARIWPEGPVCPHCGGVTRISKMQGKSTRIGAYKCYQCRKPFTVKIGTIFESSHVPLNIWLQAIYLIAGSKKGISSNQLHRTLGVTLKTAWFMSHRIREAMRDGMLAPFGSDGGIVEADETHIGRVKGVVPGGGGTRHLMKVVALVDRNSGKSRAYVVDNVNTREIAPILAENLAREATLMTDEHRVYKHLAGISPRISLSIMVGASMCAATTRWRIPTPSKAISRFSSAACEASTSSVPRSICTATWPS